MGITWEELLKKANGGVTARKKPVHHEDTLQMQCVRWMELQYPQIASNLVHCPNGGARSKREGAIFKAMGVRAGFPDLFLYLPKGDWHGLAIEMKTTEKGSRQRDNQKQWEERLKSNGYDYKIARTLDDFIHIINIYIKL